MRKIELAERASRDVLTKWAAAAKRLETAQILTAGDPVYGQLTGGNILPW